MNAYTGTQSYKGTTMEISRKSMAKTYVAAEIKEITPFVSKIDRCLRGHHGISFLISKNKKTGTENVDRKKSCCQALTLGACHVEISVKKRRK
jgi:hypothetical protein